MQLVVTQTQWPVGQGFFHTGAVAPHLHPRRPVVTYAHDCGGVSGKQAVTDAIDALSFHPQYRTEHRPLDIVFISHFDADHINGIGDLIASARPKRFVIPYVGALATLHLAAKVLLEGTLSEAERRDYWSFLASPRLWLLGRAPEASVITVGAPEGYEPDFGNLPRPHDQEPPGPGGELTAHFASDGSIPNASPVASVISRGRHREELWTWHVYVVSNGEKALKTFGAALLKKGYPHVKGEPDVTAQNIETHLAILVDASRKTDRNSTSLCLYSGPPADLEVAMTRVRPDPTEPSVISTGDGGPGWLGAGDAFLKDDDAAQEFVDAFSPFLEHVGTFAIPHHGSVESWNPRLISEFGRRGLPVPVTVVGAARREAWDHPGKDVLHSIAAHGSIVKIVSATPQSRWTTYSVVHFGAAYTAFGAPRRLAFREW